jgi:hypothetical protein
MKMRPLAAESFHADRQKDRRTDMTKLIVTFCKFPNSPKTPQELDIFPFSVKHLRLRTAPSDLIQRQYPHPKPYLRTEKDSATEELCVLFYIFGTPHIV